MQEQKNISATVKNIHEVQKERLCQIQKSVDKQNCSLKEKLTSIHNDIGIAADYLLQIHSLLVDPENPELHLIPLLSDSFQKLPSRIYGQEKEQLRQLKQSTDTVNAQLIALEESLLKYMGDYQAYMERFSQLSQQDNQILNRLLEYDDVQ